VTDFTEKEDSPSSPLPTAVGKARPVPAANIEQEEESLPPSPHQPLLEQWTAKIKEKVAQEAIVTSYINRPNDHLPTLVVQTEYWLEVARFLKEEESLAFDYVRNYAGVDHETQLEVVLFLTSFTHFHHVGLRVKTSRVEATLPSLSAIWAAANWNEREMYDLLGIHFVGHPDLKRILLPDDWVGYPLRKDYEPLDKGV
jgi:NADH-quinone oxidoreductase subunit C